MELTDQQVSSLQDPLLQGLGTGAQDGDAERENVPAFIVVLTAGELELDQERGKLLSSDLKAAWTSFCGEYNGTTTMWLMAPPDEITGNFIAGIPLVYPLSKPEVFEARLLSQGELRMVNNAMGDGVVAAMSKLRFRETFIEHSIYEIHAADSSPSWRCTKLMASVPALSSEVTVGMLLTHQLTYIKGQKDGMHDFVRLTEQPVSEYARSPRYVYCHAIAVASDESKHKDFCRRYVAPVLGSIHGFIPAIHANRFSGAGAVPWLILVLSGIAGAYWLYNIVFDLIKAYFLYRERKHVQLAISMLYDDGNLWETHVDPRYQQLKKTLAKHVQLADKDEAARKGADTNDAGTDPEDADDSAKDSDEEKKWQFHFNNSDHGRVDLRSWYLVRRTMSVLSAVRSRDINIFIGILLVANVTALLVTIVVGIHFGFEKAFSGEFGAQVVFDTIILAVLTVLIFRQGQVANDRQARDKVQLAFTQYAILSDLSCSAKYRNVIDNELTHEGQHLELLASALGSTISCMGIKDTPLTLLGFPLTFQSLSVFSGGIVSLVFAMVGTQLPPDFLGC